MSQALKLAGRGAGHVAPNPMVGAVIVKGGAVIGKGYHKRFGGPHAEVEAIRDCRKKGNDPAGAVMYVTLEPCCHYGKTPPCTEAIAAAGIKRVEIAVLDECSLVNGKGAAWLRQHGIEVNIGCCREEALRLNGGFFKLQRTGKPLVILKWAQSLDAQLAWPDNAGKRWISNETSRRHAHLLRSRCGAVLVGIGTVLADDPLLNVRIGRHPPQPSRVILDSYLRIPLTSKLVQTAGEIPVLIYTLRETQRQNTDKVRNLRQQGCQVLTVGQAEGKVSLNDVLSDLGGRGVTDLLVEGGAEVLGSFWRQKLADKVVIYIAPVFIGGNAPDGRLLLEPTGGVFRESSFRKLAGDILFEGLL